MKKEMVAAIILLLLVGIICLYMLFNWEKVKERMLLRGVVPASSVGH